jgi:hypothetical protein
MKRIKRISGFSWDRQKTIILAGGIIFVVLWERFFSYISETYGQQYAISLTALLVASIATVAALLSLRWARDTVRPFLALFGIKFTSNGVGKDYASVEFNIKNSGSLPATDVDVDVDFFDYDEEVTENNSSSKFAPANKLPTTPMMIPNNDYVSVYTFDLKDRNDVELWENIGKGKTKVRLQIRYKSLGRQHLTIQTERISKSLRGKSLEWVPIPPQKWV